MQLPAYVDDHLVNTGKISRAAILGLAGGVWATSKEYNVRYHFDRRVSALLTLPVSRSLGKDHPRGAKESCQRVQRPWRHYGRGHSARRAEVLRNSGGWKNHAGETKGMRPPHPLHIRDSSSRLASPNPTVVPTVCNLRWHAPISRPHLTACGVLAK